jgi:polyribonucleotide 5'-hydroxyl-kinase
MASETKAAESTSESNEWVLEPETEYRFELDPGSSLAIKVCPCIVLDGRYTSLSRMQLLRGQAEVFGAELAEGNVYLFGFECKAAVFTWVGCTLEMSPCLNYSNYLGV